MNRFTIKMHFSVIFKATRETWFNTRLIGRDICSQCCSKTPAISVECEKKKNSHVCSSYQWFMFYRKVGWRVLSDPASRLWKPPSHVLTGLYSFLRVLDSILLSFNWHRIYSEKEEEKIRLNSSILIRSIFCNEKIVYLMIKNATLCPLRLTSMYKKENRLLAPWHKCSW